MEHVREETVMQWLEEVKDPEIPVLSLVDLGVITEVAVEEHRIHIVMTPTFVGCPALDLVCAGPRLRNAPRPQAAPLDM